MGTGIQKVDAEEAEHRKIGKLVLFCFFFSPEILHDATLALVFG